MNFLSAIFDIRAGFMLIVMSIVAIFTLFMFIMAKTLVDRTKLLIALAVELLIIWFYYYGLRNFSSNTKSVIGAVDLVSAVTK